VHCYPESSPPTIAVAALEHVSTCERQAGHGDPQEALTLQAVVKRTALLYGLTFTYTGYPLVREAR